MLTMHLAHSLGIAVALLSIMALAPQPVPAQTSTQFSGSVNGIDHDRDGAMTIAGSAAGPNLPLGPDTHVMINALLLDERGERVQRLPVCLPASSGSTDRSSTYSGSLSPLLSGDPRTTFRVAITKHTTSSSDVRYDYSVKMSRGAITDTMTSPDCVFVSDVAVYPGALANTTGDCPGFPWPPSGRLRNRERWRDSAGTCGATGSLKATELIPSAPRGISGVFELDPKATPQHVADANAVLKTGAIVQMVGGP